MSKVLEKLHHVHKELQHLIKSLDIYEERHQKRIVSVNKRWTESARNLIYYLALRKVDLTKLQRQLATMGLSSLGRSEPWVYMNMLQTLRRIEDSIQLRSGRVHLKKQSKVHNKMQRKNRLGLNDSEALLKQHSRDIFGPSPLHRNEHIMVTAPDAALVTDEWVHSILKAGANLVRLNCAHESMIEWLHIVKCVRKVAKKMNIPCRILMDLGGPKIRIESPSKTNVKVGDILTLGKKKEASKTHLVCSEPKVIRFLKKGHPVFFDDGLIEGKITKVVKGYCEIQLVRVPNGKFKLKEKKGINFPESNIRLNELTEEDYEHLKFVAEFADIVGMSFVQRPRALYELRQQIKKMNRKPLGIVLKIETQAGFRALPRLLLEGMKDYPFAVMIARGDLAVEFGFERLVEIQEEILWLCEAAHVPTIWATQVLESLTKTGLPSRAEVTDAAQSVRAECIMLNKGPYIEKSICTLDNILRKMEKHLHKKQSLYRRLQVARL